MIKDLLRRMSHILPDSVYIGFRYKMKLGKFPHLKNQEHLMRKCSG